MLKVLHWNLWMPKYKKKTKIVKENLALYTDSNGDKGKEAGRKSKGCAITVAYKDKVMDGCKKNI